MKKTIAALLTIVLFISSVSCQNGVKKDNAQVINIQLPVNDFEKKLTDKNVQLVDVRTPEEFAEGHLKGAVNYNINGDKFREQLERLDKKSPVLVYCLSGGRSAKAARIMEEMGFTEVYNMEGGIMAWNKAGKPLENAIEKNTVKGMTLADFNKLTKGEKYVLIDFNAKWCEPCKKMAPMLEKIAKEKKDKLTFIKIDVDEYKTLTKEKGVGSIPYFELYQNGKLVWKHEGMLDEATLLAEMKL